MANQSEFCLAALYGLGQEMVIISSFERYKYSFGPFIYLGGSGGSVGGGPMANMESKSSRLSASSSSSSEEDSDDDDDDSSSSGSGSSTSSSSDSDQGH